MPSKARALKRYNGSPLGLNQRAQSGLPWCCLLQCNAGESQVEILYISDTRARLRLCCRCACDAEDEWLSALSVFKSHCSVLQQQHSDWIIISEIKERSAGVLRLPPGTRVFHGFFILVGQKMQQLLMALTPSPLPFTHKHTNAEKAPSVTP